MLWGFYELVYIKCIEDCSVYGKYLVRLVFIINLYEWINENYEFEFNFNIIFIILVMRKCLFYFIIYNFYLREI